MTELKPNLDGTTPVHYTDDACKWRDGYLKYKLLLGMDSSDVDYWGFQDRKVRDDMLSVMIQRKTS